MVLLHQDRSMICKLRYRYADPVWLSVHMMGPLGSCLSGSEDVGSYGMVECVPMTASSCSFS
jgi:hypothetical protein